MYTVLIINYTQIFNCARGWIPTHELFEGQLCIHIWSIIFFCFQDNVLYKNRMHFRVNGHLLFE